MRLDSYFGVFYELQLHPLLYCLKLTLLKTVFGIREACISITVYSAPYACVALSSASA